MYIGDGRDINGIFLEVSLKLYIFVIFFVSLRKLNYLEIFLKRWNFKSKERFVLKKRNNVFVMLKEFKFFFNFFF